MRHASTAALIAALSVVPATALADADIESGGAGPDEYVVVLDGNASGDDLAASHGAFHRYRAVFNGFAAHLPPQAVEALRNNPRVLSVERAFSVSASAQVTPTGIARIGATEAHVGDVTGAGARVAVVDTGIDVDHPDLGANIDTGLSRTFVSKGRTTKGGDDDAGHGTHVAGTIAAIDNDSGVVGVAPSATLVSLKVLDRNGNGTSPDIIAALDFITAHNNAAASYADMIHIANFSLGGNGSDSDSAYRTAFNAAVASGCFVVVAAGNETDDAANHVPSAYDSVFTVSAMDPVTGAFASFSNYGADVDVVAPGVSVLSTTMGGSTGTKNGTSMATPHVAGAAALFVGRSLAGLTKADAVAAIRSEILATAEPITMSGDNDGLHEPLVDAARLAGIVPEPAVVVSLTKDKTAYTMQDGVATVTAAVTDELYAPIDGLTDLDVTLSGADVISFAALGGGAYAFDIDISQFAKNDVKTLTVSATDARSLTGVQTTTLVRTDPIFVSNISYLSTRSALKITVSVVDTGGAPVSGASVSISVTKDGALYGSATSSTDSAGNVTFNANRAPSGRYVTTVTAVSKAGSVYDPTLNFVDPGFTR